MERQSNGPSYEEVTRHANKRRAEGFPEVDPRDFWAYYESIGWKRRGDVILKWKVVFREWEMRSESPELPPARFRVRDKLYARYVLVWGKEGIDPKPEAREWDDDRCWKEYQQLCSG